MENNSPSFPLYVFPPPIRMIINETYSEYHYPISYIASALLFSVSVAIGNCRAIVMNASWKVRPILFMALLGGPGAGKTHPIKFATAPFIKLDSKTLGKYKQELKEWRKNPIDKRDDKPIPKQLRLQDCTMEAVTKTLDIVKRGIFVYVDELKGWISSFNKYNGGGGDLEQWLSIFNGVPIAINRKTQDDIIFINNPFVSVIGGIQPAIMAKLFGGEKMDNGLFYRLLFVGNSSEGMPVLWGDEDLPSNLEHLWEEIIYKILDSGGYFDDTEVYKEYHFSQDAWAYIKEWRNTIEEHNVQEEPEYKIAIFRKIQDYCLRFALIIHTMREATGEIAETVEVDSMTAMMATMLANYFYEQSQIAYELVITGGMVNDKFFDLMNALNDTFTTGQALAVGERMGMSVSTIKRLLAVGPNDPFLRKLRHGHYEKIF